MGPPLLRMRVYILVGLFEGAGDALLPVHQESTPSCIMDDRVMGCLVWIAVAILHPTYLFLASSKGRCEVGKETVPPLPVEMARSPLIRQASSDRCSCASQLLQNSAKHLYVAICTAPHIIPAMSAREDAVLLEGRSSHSLQLIMAV